MMVRPFEWDWNPYKKDPRDPFYKYSLWLECFPHPTPRPRHTHIRTPEGGWLAVNLEAGLTRHLIF